MPASGAGRNASPRKGGEGLLRGKTRTSRIKPPEQVVIDRVLALPTIGQWGMQAVDLRLCLALNVEREGLVELAEVGTAVEGEQFRAVQMKTDGRHGFCRAG
nr:hypothetical protein [Tepidamorphus gemmatus]